MKSQDVCSDKNLKRQIGHKSKFVQQQIRAEKHGYYRETLLIERLTVATDYAHNSKVAYRVNVSSRQ